MNAIVNRTKTDAERGQTLAEYAAVLGLVAAAVALAVGTVGTQVAGLVQSAVDAFG
jgi:Flp pilus assembly pilin Flp